jgi:hypothetical protein
VFPVKHFYHGLFVDSHHRAIGHCCCRAHAEGLPRKATFSKEIARSQNLYCGFFPARGYHSEFYPPFLNVKNSIGRVALSKNRLLFGERCDASAVVDGRKKCLGIEFAAFLGSRCGCRDWPPFQNSECAEGNIP